MKYLNCLMVLTAMSLSHVAFGQGQSQNKKGVGQGQGQGAVNSSKPPPKTGVAGNSSGKPCGLSLGSALETPGNGADNRSARAKAVLEDLSQACDESDTIEMTLNNGKKLTFQKDRSTPRGFSRPDSLAYWAGSDENGNSFNFVRDTNGFVHGSFTDMDTGDVHQIGLDALGEQVVTITPSDLFPEEADPDVDESPESDGVRNLEESMAFSASTDASTHGLRGISRNLEHQGRMLLDDSGGNLDVMVIWTKKAECRKSGQSAGCTVTTATHDAMQALVELAVQETNTAYTASGVQTQLNLVHFLRHETYVEATSNAFNTALSNLRGTTDGYMDEIHSLRTLYGADIVAMIIDDSQYCGLGYLGPRSDLMFSITAWNCATGYYSFGHEIGHNMGLNHDRGTTNACSNSNSNYGYREPQGVFRTILAYNCATGQCDNIAKNGCPRVQRFSNPALSYGGKPTGTTYTNNAAKINSVKAEVAAYKTHVVSPSGGGGGGTPTNPPTTGGGTTTTCVDFKLVIKTDNYPGETTWNLKNAAGTTIGSDGPYSSKLATYQYTGCLANEKHTFTINDTWGDGVCCGYGQGYYSIYWNGAQVANGGSFGKSQTVTING